MDRKGEILKGARMKWEGMVIDGGFGYRQGVCGKKGVREVNGGLVKKQGSLIILLFTWGIVWIIEGI